MNDTQTRPRRSLVVVLLDGALRLFTAVQAGPTPDPKVRVAGARRGIGRYLLLAGVVAALAGTTLLVVVLVRAPGGPTPPPDPAAALPGLRSRPAGPSVATGSTPSGVPGSHPTSGIGKAAATTAATTPVPGTPGAPGTAGTTGTPAPLTASYRTSSVTAGLFDYQMTVTVTNPGTVPADGWTLAVTLPRPTLLVSGTSGATAAQDGSVWTFRPVPATARVPAGGSVKVVFSVHGATLIDSSPRDCRIDGRPCTG